MGFAWTNFDFNLSFVILGWWARFCPEGCEARSKVSKSWQSRLAVNMVYTTHWVYIRNNIHVSVIKSGLQTKVSPLTANICLTAPCFWQTLSTFFNTYIQCVYIYNNLYTSFTIGGLYFFTSLWCHQTWLAGTWPPHVGFSRHVW